jgi:hypothetical protein
LCVKFLKTWKSWFQYFYFVCLLTEVYLKTLMISMT